MDFDGAENNTDYQPIKLELWAIQIIILTGRSAFQTLSIGILRAAKSKECLVTNVLKLTEHR